jgi:hypothetical protein
MKNIVKICLVIFCLAIFCPKALAQTPIGIKQNTFTTNKDPSFLITEAAKGVLQQQGQGQQYYVVSGAGESIANGNYLLDTSFTNFPVWTNYSTYIDQYYNQTNWWLINPNAVGQTLYISQIGGLTGFWTNIFQYYPGLYLKLAGSPPMPKVTLAYSGVASFITESLLQNAGGLTVSNVAQYSDTNGEASNVFQTLPPPSNTNLATQTQLLSVSNNFPLALQSYAPPVITNINNAVYSNNSSGYLTKSATNGMTQLGLSVVSAITNGNGTLIITPNQTTTGIVYTLTLNVSNITYITNINAVTLAGWGAFTTNSYSWQNYLAPVGDWQQATNYTNGLISAATAAATFQPTGSYLTSSSNLNYSKFTNAPAIPTTNGLVTSNIFIGFATPAWVLLQNYLQSSNVAAYYATTSSVISAIAPYPTTTTLNASSNYLALANTTNVNTIALHWGINQALVASIIVNSNMTATFTTNSGVITVTLGSTTNLSASSKAGLQPASGNLTNWSGVPTNQILLTPNLVTYLVAGNNVSITYTTNSGVHATVAAQYQLNSPVQTTTAFVRQDSSSTNYYYQIWQNSSGGTPISWNNPLPATPTTVKFYYNGSDVTSAVESLLTNFTYSATQFSGKGGAHSFSSLGYVTLQVVGLCY